MRGGWLRLATLALASVLVLTACGGGGGESADPGEFSVSGSAQPERVEAYEQMVVTALEQTEALWGRGSVERPVRVVLPGTAEEFAALTGGATGSQNAPAVTVGSLGEAHVVVHPDSWHRLSPEGRQAVLTHEVTHLSQQGDGPVPAWLGEGLAEYTAHRDSSLSPAAIAGSALDGVRDGELPTAWPQPGSSASWDGYALSWLACLYLADEWSEDQLVEFYRAVEAGAPLDDAFPAVFGVSESEALAGWADWLTSIAQPASSG